MKTKIVKRKLEKGELFRVAGPRGVPPDIWTWDGQYQNPKEEYGYICRRLHDGFVMTLYPTNTIVPLNLPEEI